MTGPDELRARFARHSAAALAEGIAALRSAPVLSGGERNEQPSATWDRTNPGALDSRLVGIADPAARK